MDFGKMEEEYFCKKGLNEGKGLKGREKFRVWRRKFDRTGRRAEVSDRVLICPSGYHRSRFDNATSVWLDCAGSTPTARAYFKPVAPMSMPTAFCGVIENGNFAD